jgi:hypothetical protein
MPEPLTPNQRAAIAHGKAAAAYAALATAWGLAAKATRFEPLAEYARFKARDALLRSLRFAAHAIAYASGAVTVGGLGLFAYHESPTLMAWRDGLEFTGPAEAWPRDEGSNR